MIYIIIFKDDLCVNLVYVLVMQMLRVLYRCGIVINSLLFGLLTAEFLISISKLVAPPLDEVVRHGGVRGGCRSSQRFVARHALRSRTHHVHFKSAACFYYRQRMSKHYHYIHSLHSINQIC